MYMYVQLGHLAVYRNDHNTEDQLYFNNISATLHGHHPLSAHESEQTPRDSEGQGSLACCSSWVAKNRI